MDTTQLIAAINKAADLYIKQLQDDGINASCTLANFESSYEFDGDKFVVYFNLADYWKYVEYGRSSGKFPPISAIENWIKVKGIVPRAINGKIPSTKSLAFLIARSISRNGTIKRFNYGGEHGLSKLVLSKDFEAVASQIKHCLAYDISQQIKQEWEEALKNK